MGGNETWGPETKLGACVSRPGPKTATAINRINSLQAICTTAVRIVSKSQGFAHSERAHSIPQSCRLLIHVA